MGMLSSGPKDPPKIRIKTVLIKGIPPSVKRVPASSVRPPGRPPAATASPGPAGRAGTKSASPLPCSSSDERRVSRKRKAAPMSGLPAAAATKRPTPASPSRGAQRVNFGAESSGEEDDDDRWMRVDGVGKKKKKRPHWCKDSDRKLRNMGAFEDGAAACAASAAAATTTATAAAGHGADDDGAATFIHAEAVASLALKCEPAIGASENDVGFELQYPSLLPRERYELVAGKDKVEAVADALQVVRHVAETYLTEQQARLLTDPRHGVIRRLEKASNRNINDVAGFRAALGVYNDLLLSLVRAGAVAENLDSREELLPEDLVAFILTQVYDRAVAPQVDLLTKYEPGSDNVYGELLHPLVTRILVDEIGLRSGQVFVDLGSGVGNVVIQAALEIGCESWGCEMMENACNLAEGQLREFRARCALWGIRPGRVRLERGDFRKNEPIQHALKRADAVLVNNQAFTARLNDDLVRMFLDLKPGCRIISLKSFVRSSCHNINDVGSTILDVRELTYPEGGQVSWTNAGGSYCISTKK